MVRLNPTTLTSIFGLHNVRVNKDELTSSCPFTENHKRGDTRPSFGISLNNGVAHCFACGWGGSVISLAHDLLGMTFIEAQRTFYGDITPDEIQYMMYGEQSKTKPMTALEIDISRWCPHNHPYWIERGFTEQTIGEWMLGYDRISNRVVVPIYFRGELMGWTKRALDNVTQPKWSNNPELQKSKILFGLDRVVGDEIILVEAPLSVIMLAQQGIKNAVASMGAALSDAQVGLIRQAANRVVVFYDPDEAGMTGTRKAIKKLSNFVDVHSVGPTRDDPAAQSYEENHHALYEAPLIASWEYR